MIRKRIFRLPDTRFNERGKEIHRVEALSDAVFAFSVSLLVASLEVPETFDELLKIIQGALPFFATVAMIFLFWYQQYKYFRRYGLHDRRTILFNLAYLAVILFYVYPLKFLFSLLIRLVTGIDLFPHATEKGLTILSQEDFPLLIILFSTGYAVIWFLLYLMYERALTFAKKIDLTAWETEFTKMEMRGAVMNTAIGVLAIFAALAGFEGLSGIIYMCIPVVLVYNRSIFKKKVKLLHQQKK